MFKHRCPGWWFHNWSKWGAPEAGKAYNEYNIVIAVTFQHRHCERCAMVQTRRIKA